MWQQQMGVTRLQTPCVTVKGESDLRQLHGKGHAVLQWPGAGPVCSALPPNIRKQDKHRSPGTATTQCTLCACAMIRFMWTRTAVRSFIKDVFPCSHRAHPNTVRHTLGPPSMRHSMANKRKHAASAMVRQGRKRPSPAAALALAPSPPALPAYQAGSWPRQTCSPHSRGPQPGRSRQPAHEAGSRLHDTARLAVLPRQDRPSQHVHWRGACAHARGSLLSKSEHR